jgi:hypothetical protein
LQARQALTARLSASPTFSALNNSTMLLLASILTSDYIGTVPDLGEKFQQRESVKMHTGSRR